jgi:hypothetical protein
MSDRIDTFTRQFTPIDGGYLYYPSRKGGGKFVTAEEFETLASDWHRVAGRAGMWKSVGLTTLVIVIWTLLSRTLAAPGWADRAVAIACAAALSGWVLWASYAPRRLVKGRPDFAPPRAASAARREARAALNWPIVLMVLLFSGVALFARLISPEWTLGWWAWVIGSCVFFVAYLWIAFEKVRDRQR